MLEIQAAQSSQSIFTINVANDIELQTPLINVKLNLFIYIYFIRQEILAMAKATVAR